MYCFKCIVLNVIPLIYKMNKIINKFFLTGDRFMPEMHLKQPEFTYSACGPFTKHKERIKKFKETMMHFNMMLLMLLIKI